MRFRWCYTLASATNLKPISGPREFLNRFFALFCKELQIRPVAPLLQILVRDEPKRRRVHAVTLPRRRGPVGKNVTQVGIPVLASHFGPHREELPVLSRRDVLRLQGFGEAWPSRPRVVLVERAEERLSGYDVNINPLPLVVIVFILEGRFSTLRAALPHIEAA